MSAFLGPVHHWMYGKIQLQEELTGKLVTLVENSGWSTGLAACLTEAYGPVETAPLETVIDTGNIHGWLARRVSLAEERFAKAVTTALSANGASRLEALTAFMEAQGRAHAVAAGADPETAYQTLDGLLLDGMPCDGGRHVTSADEEELVWEYNPAMHALCQTPEGREIYALLRKAFLRGALEGSGLRLESLSQEIYRIGKAG